MTEQIRVEFYSGGPVTINIARINHLKYLNLPFENKTVFETGCGGKGDFTKYM